MLVARFADLVHDPSYFLHNIDIEQDRLVFLPTERQLLRDASFLDGRSPIAAGEAVICGLSSALEQAVELPRGRDRFIFHVSFCGSTLLARILDLPGRACVLREPNCLVDLADWTAALGRGYRTDSRLEPLLRLACASLRARWRPDEPVVVKPSNWANNLLPILDAASGDAIALFITATPRGFLRAVFRGGRDRIAFASRVAAHLASGDAGGETLVGAAVRASPDPLGQVANLALVAHHLQLNRFRSTVLAGRLRSWRLIAFDSLVHTPIETVQAANSAFDLGIPLEELSASVATNIGRDAKQPDVPYSAVEHLRGDQAVEEAYGSHFDAALAWIADLLPSGLRSETDDTPARRVG